MRIGGVEGGKREGLWQNSQGEIGQRNANNDIPTCCIGKINHKSI